ncbi:MAG: hypothetical protein IMF05_10945 [Proteobacteria bacterium]|nr:hypothetical protein [Pseudomonadota bacterium]
MRKSPLLATLSVLVALAPWTAMAQDAKWPGLYFEQCGNCHGSADALLEERAILKSGVLLGRSSNRDIRTFLGSHFGQRSSEDVDIVYREILRVARGGGRFKQQCAICHVSAEELARKSLILRDGELYGRYSGRRIADYLTGHGRLATQEDAVFFEQVLRRNLPGGG